MLEQDRIHAEVYHRTPEGDWRFTEFDSHGRLKLPCVRLELPLEGVYAGVG